MTIISNSEEDKVISPAFGGTPPELDYTWKVIDFSEANGWEKTTEAMKVEGLGSLVRATTLYKGAVSTALTFVPFADIVGDTHLALSNTIGSTPD